MPTIRQLLLLFVAVLVAAGAWLGSSEPLPETPAYWLARPDSLDELRRAASGIGPREVRAGIIGRTALPRWFNTAWGGFGRERRVFISLQLVYPDGHVMIDAPFGAETHRALLGDDSPFDADEFSRMQQALATAKSIFISHVHRDHLGGLVDSPDPRALLARTEVTAEQKAGFRRKGEVDLHDPSTLGFDVTDFDDLQRVLDFSRLQQVAPGLVAIKNPGHTPGHLMFYIRTADGREILYVGDLAWSYRNFEAGRTRSRAVAKYFLGEDTSAVADQLRAVTIFAAAHPEVAILISHDADRLEQQIANGVVPSGIR
jgi:glyoxylase-like metal-dependent hydrolase (beta-lactamase superfamily II)